LFSRAGEIGILGLQAPEEFGGGGVKTSFKFNAIVSEEAQAAGMALGGLRLQTDICMPYFVRYANDKQALRWIPRLVSGEAISAIAISEPGTGSDVRSIATTAVRDGDEYIINGSKTFISNGSIADLLIVVVKIADPAGADQLSLIVVEGDTPGFTKGRNLEKIGLKAQDVAELSFIDARVPVENLLGDAGRAFDYLMANLVQERLSIAINSQAAAVAALQVTLNYVKERKAFGATVGSFQNTKFELAACAAEIEAGQAMADQALSALDDGELTPVDAAKVKLFLTETQGRVVDRCLQLHGGYGYVLEYPIAHAYADARVSRIYGGSSEIMKVIIAKSMDL
jgi:alkylation response protein AidB-like acyl-CoA dehydrogenase